MSLSAETPSGGANPARRAVRQPTRDVTGALQRRKRSPGPFLLCALAGMVVGGVAGALIMRQRQHTREVVVAVNGAIIDQAAFYRNLESAAGGQVIRKMVGDELQIQFAQKMGVAPADADVDAKFKETVNQPGFDKTTLQNKEAVDDFKRGIRVGLSRANVLTKSVAVTEADERAFYEANVDRRNPRALFRSPETVALQAIITANAEQANQAAQELAKGVPFAAVAKHYSKDANSKDNGGLMPLFQRSQPGTSKLGPMEEVLFNLKIGGQTGPRQFGKTWWIVKCLDKQPEKTRSFAQVKEKCRTGALLVKGLPANGAKAEENFKTFQETSQVQAFWDRYRAATNVK